MNLPIKSLKGQIMQWDGFPGHIAMQIGSRYTSFGPDKTKPEEPVHDKKGIQVTRFDVPSMTSDLGLKLFKQEGMLKAFKDDLGTYGKKCNLATFELPYEVIPKTPSQLPSQLTYQLFDAVKGDRSHNNCVDYVRAEIFALLDDKHLMYKRYLMRVHVPKKFFIALKNLEILEKLRAENIHFYEKYDFDIKQAKPRKVIHL
jgi:hypothetical protein